MGKETQGWLWSLGCWVQGLRLGLASAESGPGEMAGGPFLSLSTLSTEGRLGGEPEVISSDSAAILLSEELPWKIGHLHVALACLPANLHATQHSLCFVLRQERDTCDPDRGSGASLWPGIQLPWVSSVLSSATAHAPSTPSRRMVA